MVFDSVILDNLQDNRRCDHTSYDKDVNGTCTCGVELVEGARFCHKCGRPVDGTEPVDLEAVPAEVAVAPASPVPPPIPQQQTSAVVGFQSRASIRTAVLSAVISFVSAFVFVQVTANPAFMVVAPPLSGLLAVILLARRSNRSLTTIEGARQGWISGLFFFLIVLVLTTLLFLFIWNHAELIPLMREQARAKGTLTPDVAKLFEEMQQPGVFAGSLLMAIVFFFVFFTSLASLGGMLGSRFAGTGKTRPEIGA